MEEVQRTTEDGDLTLLIDIDRGAVIHWQEGLGEPHSTWIQCMRLLANPLVPHRCKRTIVDRLNNSILKGDTPHGDPDAGDVTGCRNDFGESFCLPRAVPVEHVLIVANLLMGPQIPTCPSDFLASAQAIAVLLEALLRHCGDTRKILSDSVMTYAFKFSVRVRLLWPVRDEMEASRCSILRFIASYTKSIVSLDPSPSELLNMGVGVLTSSVLTTRPLLSRSTLSEFIGLVTSAINTGGAEAIDVKLRDDLMQVETFDVGSRFLLDLDPIDDIHLQCSLLEFLRDIFGRSAARSVCANAIVSDLFPVMTKLLQRMTDVVGDNLTIFQYISQIIFICAQCEGASLSSKLTVLDSVKPWSRLFVNLLRSQGRGDSKALPDLVQDALVKSIPAVSQLVVICDSLKKVLVDEDFVEVAASFIDSQRTIHSTVVEALFTIAGALDATSTSGTGALAAGCGAQMPVDVGPGQKVRTSAAKWRKLLRSQAMLLQRCPDLTPRAILSAVRLLPLLAQTLPTEVAGILAAEDVLLYAVQCQESEYNEEIMNCLIHATALIVDCKQSAEVIHLVESNFFDVLLSSLSTLEPEAVDRGVAVVSQCFEAHKSMLATREGSDVGSHIPHAPDTEDLLGTQRLPSPYKGLESFLNILSPGTLWSFKLSFQQNAASLLRIFIFSDVAAGSLQLSKITIGVLSSLLVHRHPPGECLTDASLRCIRHVYSSLDRSQVAGLSVPSAIVSSLVAQSTCEGVTHLSWSIAADLYGHRCTCEALRQELVTQINPESFVRIVGLATSLFLQSKAGSLGEVRDVLDVASSVTGNKYQQIDSIWSDGVRISVINSNDDILAKLSAADCASETPPMSLQWYFELVGNVLEKGNCSNISPSRQTERTLLPPALTYSRLSHELCSFSQLSPSAQVSACFATSQVVRAILRDVREEVDVVDLLAKLSTQMTSALEICACRLLTQDTSDRDVDSARNAAVLCFDNAVKALEFVATNHPVYARNAFLPSLGSLPGDVGDLCGDRSAVIVDIIRASSYCDATGVMKLVRRIVEGGSSQVIDRLARAGVPRALLSRLDLEDHENIEYDATTILCLICLGAEDGTHKQACTCAKIEGWALLTRQLKAYSDMIPHEPHTKEKHKRFVNAISAVIVKHILQDDTSTVAVESVAALVRFLSCWVWELELEDRPSIFQGLFYLTRASTAQQPSHLIAEFIAIGGCELYSSIISTLSNQTTTDDGVRSTKHLGLQSDELAWILQVLLGASAAERNIIDVHILNSLAVLVGGQLEKNIGGAEAYIYPLSCIVADSAYGADSMECLKISHVLVAFLEMEFDSPLAYNLTVTLLTSLYKLSNSNDIPNDSNAVWAVFKVLRWYMQDDLISIYCLKIVQNYLRPRSELLVNVCSYARDLLLQFLEREEPLVLTLEILKEQFTFAKNPKTSTETLAALAKVLDTHPANTESLDILLLRYYDGSGSPLMLGVESHFVGSNLLPSLENALCANLASNVCVPPRVYELQAELLYWVASRATRVVMGTNGVNGIVEMLSRPELTEKTLLHALEAVWYLANQAPSAHCEIMLTNRVVERLCSIGTYQALKSLWPLAKAYPHIRTHIVPLIFNGGPLHTFLDAQPPLEGKQLVVNLLSEIAQIKDEEREERLDLLFREGWIPRLVAISKDVTSDVAVTQCARVMKEISSSSNERLRDAVCHSAFLEVMLERDLLSSADVAQTASNLAYGSGLSSRRKILFSTGRLFSKFLQDLDKPMVLRLFSFVTDINSTRQQRNELMHLGLHSKLVSIVKPSEQHESYRLCILHNLQRDPAVRLKLAKLQFPWPCLLKFRNIERAGTCARLMGEYLKASLQYFTEERIQQALILLLRCPWDYGVGATAMQLLVEVVKGSERRTSHLKCAVMHALNSFLQLNPSALSQESKSNALKIYEATLIGHLSSFLSWSFRRKETLDPDSTAVTLGRMFNILSDEKEMEEALQVLTVCYEGTSSDFFNFGQFNRSVPDVEGIHSIMLSVISGKLSLGFTREVLKYLELISSASPRPSKSMRRQSSSRLTAVRNTIVANPSFVRYLLKLVAQKPQLPIPFLRLLVNILVNLCDGADSKQRTNRLQAVTGEALIVSLCQTRMTNADELSRVQECIICATSLLRDNLLTIEALNIPNVRKIPYPSGEDSCKLEESSEKVTTLFKMDEGQQIVVSTRKDGSKQDALDEILIYVKLGKHRHLTQLIGVTTTPEGVPSLVTPYAKFGNLRQFCHSLEADHRELSTLSAIIMSLQICEGMEILEAEKIVHRDLAARNVLVYNYDEVTPKNILVKLTDYGLSRQVSDHYYGGSGLLPLRWMSPEAIEKRKFSSLSDVWAFGVLMWEIWSLGSVPYPDLTTNKEVVDFVMSRRTLPKPPSCPEDVFGVMKRCWSFIPSERPSFSELRQELMSHLATWMQDSLCVVCLENRSTELLVPCGHTCVCVDCAPHVKEFPCPICRSPITDVVHVYFS